MGIVNDLSAFPFQSDVHHSMVLRRSVVFILYICCRKSSRKKKTAGWCERGHEKRKVGLRVETNTIENLVHNQRYEMNKSGPKTLPCGSPHLMKQLRLCL